MGVVVNKKGPGYSFEGQNNNNRDPIIIMMKDEPVTLFIICDGLRSLHVSKKVEFYA
jgi:hypothetical protein